MPDEPSPVPGEVMLPWKLRTPVGEIRATHADLAMLLQDPVIALRFQNIMLERALVEEHAKAVELCKDSPGNRDSSMTTTKPALQKPRAKKNGM